MPNVVEDMFAAVEELSFDSVNADESTRRRIIASAERTLARLRTPYEQLWQFGLVGPMVIWVTRVLADVGLFEGWAKAGGKEATLHELWECCNATNLDLELLRRLLRVLIAAHVVQEVGEARYKPTPTSLALADRKGVAVQAFLVGSLSNYMAMASFNPTFLRKMNYETPTDPNNTGFMAFTGGKKLFEMCALYPWMVEMFQAHMEAYADMRLDWTQIYDTEQLLVGFDFDKEAKNILFVDIGGGKGIDVNRLLKKHPDIPMRRIVLQELPEVMAIASATASEKVICQPYDFFKEQPITGARAYFLHAVLHDWDDIDARRILKQVNRAMTNGYSRLLICDIAMPPVGATMFQVYSDMAMLTSLSSKDRTEEHWIRLLRSANFEIVKIWRHEGSTDCVLEAELAQPQNVAMPQRMSWVV